MDIINNPAIPDNINPLSPNGFQFSIAKLPELTYFCQEVIIPTMSLGEFNLNNPFVPIPIPGEILTFDALNIRFLIDENMDNYIALHNWMIGLGFPDTYDQYVDFIEGSPAWDYGELSKNYSTATMTIMNNTNTAVQNIQFANLFPISVSSVQFQSTNSDVQYLVGDATFRYSYYKFVAI